MYKIVVDWKNTSGNFITCYIVQIFWIINYINHLVGPICSCMFGGAQFGDQFWYTFNYVKLQTCEIANHLNEYFAND